MADWWRVWKSSSEALKMFREIAKGIGYEPDLSLCSGVQRPSRLTLTFWNSIVYAGTMRHCSADYRRPS